MLRRPRRNRKTESIRKLVSETKLHAENFICPLFVIQGENTQDPIPGMPGVYHLGIDRLLYQVEKLHQIGCQGIALFPKIEPSLKNERGSQSLDENGLIPRAIRAIKKRIPSMTIFADVALDPYTSHGHDGLVNENGEVINDATVNILTHQALCLAAAGADIVAPSDMMDGRVGAIRQVLDRNQFTHISICAYTAKYASAFYGPFRDAVGSSLSFGDKKTYQMDPANRREALIEAQLDSSEGADMLLVKPALLYLDVIAAIKNSTLLPLCAYHVSGEYAMLMAAADSGLLDRDSALMEATLSIKRAGADLIFTYGVEKLIELLSRDTAECSAAALV